MSFAKAKMGTAGRGEAVEWVSGEVPLPVWRRVVPAAAHAEPCVIAAAFSVAVEAPGALRAIWAACSPALWDKLLRQLQLVEVGQETW